MQVTEEAGQLRAALELASERENQNVDALDGATAKEEHMQKIVSNLRSDLDVHRAKLAEMHNVSAQLQRAQGQLAESGTKLARQAQEMETLDRCVGEREERAEEAWRTELTLHVRGQRAGGGEGRDRRAEPQPGEWCCVLFLSVRAPRDALYCASRNGTDLLTCWYRLPCAVLVTVLRA